MTGIELPKTQTKVDPLELRAALRLAWWHLFNDDPARETLTVLLSQSALETGRWKAAWNFNFGNAKYPSKIVNGQQTIPLGSRGDYQFFPCAENRADGSQYWIYPPDRGACFVAFKSLELGAAFYLGLLARRYRPAWEALCSGDPATFVNRIKALGYFTADLAIYRKNVVSIWNEYMLLPDLGPVSASEQAAASEFTYRELLDLVRADMESERDGQE